MDIPANTISQNTDPVRLRLKSHPRYLAVARALVRGMGELAGLPQKRVHQLALAVDEAMTNVIRHCYSGADDQDLELSFDLSPMAPDGSRSLEICLRDWGEPIDLDCIRIPPASAPETPGGLGVRLIHDVATSVDVQHVQSGGHELRLLLDCPARKQAAAG
jgi:serine/threonine-protein kinase RsbW